MVVVVKYRHRAIVLLRRRRRLDEVLTTLRMPRRFARENFTSGRRRRPISSSMLKVRIY